MNRLLYAPVLFIFLCAAQQRTETASFCVCQLDLAPFDALIWPHPGSCFRLFVQTPSKPSTLPAGKV